MSTTGHLESHWTVLIVDDDHSIHELTHLVFRNRVIESRPIHFVSAYSGQEAKSILAERQDICVAIVDVIMEDDQAGLDLIRWIRQELNNKAIRLILRTGHAGGDIEESVVKNYDINDFREKTELHSAKIVTCLTTAIRDFNYNQALIKNNDQLSQLLTLSNSLIATDQVEELVRLGKIHLEQFLNQAITKYCICHLRPHLDNSAHWSIYVLDELGFIELNSLQNAMLSAVSADHIKGCIAREQTICDETLCSVLAYTHGNSTFVVHFSLTEPSHLSHAILNLFATNLALALDNLLNHLKIDEAQQELVHILGEAIEARSLETGSHVKRVALICAKLAALANQPAAYVEAIRIAAPLHDIGKIAIPESILHKPGKLDDKEWAIMKSHAAIGGNMLQKSTTEISQLGSRLASGHHENWDGTGYPLGQRGEDIPLEARIMAIADVFDALGSKRVYKEAWGSEKMKALFIEEQGKKFDPKLCQILLDHWDSFLLIRQQYSDEKL